MTYQETLSFIHSLDKFGSRPGLDRVQQLFDEVPGLLNQRFIHVAGTNGKGSVSNMLSSVLTAAGYKTGLFISPYITEFRERIQINGEMIAEQALCEAVTFFMPILERLNRRGVIITEFEFLTAVAFYLFRREGCDIVVCEVGMGGLLDSTNLIPRPLCAVITRIDLDHTAVLGDTIEAIAAQKAGIIKDSSLTVTADQPPRALTVLRSAASAHRNPLYLSADVTLSDVCCTLEGTRFTYASQRMTLPLLGEHQLDNLRCALRTLEVLEDAGAVWLSTDSIREGLARVQHPARFELISSDPPVILDGAHNRNGLEAFVRAVRYYRPDSDKSLVIGMLADKDSDAVGLLDGVFSHIVVTDIQNPRAMSAAELREKLSGLAESVEVVHDPAAAFERAKSYGGDVFICGSLYLASEIRPYLLSNA